MRAVCVTVMNIHFSIYRTAGENDGFTSLGECLFLLCNFVGEKNRSQTLDKTNICSTFVSKTHCLVFYPDALTSFLVLIISFVSTDVSRVRAVIRVSPLSNVFHPNMGGLEKKVDLS